MVLPLFALANVGVVIDLGVARDALTSPIGTGVTLGLVLGKPAGILLGSVVAVRLGIARLPADTGWLHMAGIGALAGIGCTVSLFIATLAFDEDGAVAAATFAVLAASCVAGVTGASLLAIAHRRSEGASKAHPSRVQ